MTLKVGDRFRMTVEHIFTKGSVIEYTGEETDGHSPLFKLISGKCYYNNYKDTPGAYLYDYEKYTVKEETVMSGFKVGDRVYLKKSSKWFGMGGSNPSTENEYGTIVKEYDGIYNVEWDAGYKNDEYTDECLGLVEETKVKTYEMYEKLGTQLICGETYVDKAKRKHSDGSEQYVIQYTSSSQRGACVRKQDIPALVAALLDIYDGTVKEEEIPF